MYFSALDKKGYRPEWGRKIRSNLAFAPQSVAGGWKVTVLHLSVELSVIVHWQKRISWVKQTATLSRENSYLARDCWNRKYLLSKPLNFNSKVFKSWLGKLCENTYAKTLLQKHLHTNYTFLPESFHVSLWFWKLRHDLSSHHHH